MSFAQGALPIAIGAPALDLRVGMTEAIRVIDGNPSGYVFTPKPALPEDAIEITYSLPALTVFERFAVPNVSETPSPFQTFFGNIEVQGSATSADGPYVVLAERALTTHEEDDQVTDLTMAPDQPKVLWVRLRMQGGVQIERERSSLEFSELIGHGIQREAEMSSAFDGVWSGRGVKLELKQDGPTVTGCYDGRSMLTGTVQGKVLRAVGADAAGVPSQFILIGSENRGIRGLRSTNGAPFKPYDGEAASHAPACLEPEPPTLGCGAVVHGIGFDYDSDVIRPSSEAVIAALFQGLSGESGVRVQIVGHSSSEGAAEYNRDLSHRRAQSVVAALVSLGLNASQLTAVGRGEDDPIASNQDEAGRSLNRRVEVLCL